MSSNEDFHQRVHEINEQIEAQLAAETDQERAERRAREEDSIAAAEREAIRPQPPRSTP